MNIANQLTVFRIFLIPIFIFLLVGPFNWGEIYFLGSTVPMNWFIAGIIFAVASITDFLDGYLARKYDLSTPFGAFLDPMADKLLVISAFIALVELNVITGWVVIVIVSRELLVTGLRLLIVESGGEILAAALPGKIKTLSQMFSILFYLWNNPIVGQYHINLAQILLYVCLFFTVYSGVEYFYQGRFVFKNYR